MRKQKKWYSKSQYEDDAMLAEGIITEMIMKNEPIGDKYKTVFKVPSHLCPEGRICVYWGITGVEVGDHVFMKGRFNGDVFLVWRDRLMYKREEKPKEDTINQNDNDNNEYIS